MRKSNQIIACRGYIAPEFIDKGQISFKNDIFSLGVIMINLLSGHDGCIPEKVRIIYQSLFVFLFYNKFY
jgi:serine/threonine protein kinase